MNWTEVIAHNPFYEIAAILALAVVLGGLGRFLKQPLIVMFIALGIIVGPSVLNIFQSHEKIDLLAEIGISILLFIVGLRLDLRIIQSVGKIAALTGIGQVVFTSLFGYFIGLAMGFPPMHSFYIAVALTFSSTIIIVKLLSDKKELDSLHGRIAVGFLIVQDIVVILAMIVLSAIRKGKDTSLTEDILTTLLSGAVLLVFVWIASKWLIPGLSKFLAKSQELLVLFGVALSVFLSAFSHFIGFSGEVGAFLGGVTLASSQFREVISSRLVSLRDFLLLFFFVNLGATLDLSIIGSQLDSALYFSAFVLVGNPLIVLIIMGYLGYRKRTGFLAGLTVAQISEFSLIFAGLGLTIGHINEEVVGLITLVGLITIGLSTYLILYSNRIFDLIAPALSIFERKDPYRENRIIASEQRSYDIILIGLGKFGGRIAGILDDHPSISYLGVDFDPEVVQDWREKGRDVVYGDLEDTGLLEQVPYERSKVVISTIPDKELSIHLIKGLMSNNYKGEVYITVMNERDRKELQGQGASDILQPQQMAAMNFYNTYLKDRGLT